MPTIPLTTQDPGVFGYIEGQTFYNEQLAHEILKHAAAMAAEGYEISFQLPDTHDYNSLYSRQTITISSLVNALNAKTDREELIPYYQTYANQIQELATLPVSRDNYLLRAASIASANVLLGSENGGGFADLENLEDILKTALIQYNGESVETTLLYELSKFHANLENLEDILKTALIQYNGESVETTLLYELSKFHAERLPVAELEALWLVQNAAIEEQSNYLLLLKQELQEKREKLPERQETQSFLGTLWNKIFEERIEETISTLIVGLLRYIFTMGDIASKAIAFLSIVALLAIKDLIDRCIQGETICEKYIDENAQLLKLTPSEYAYELRLKIIKNHNDHIANLLADIRELEATAKSGSSEDMAELVQAVKDLSMTGYEIEAEDFKIRKLGQTLTTGSW